MAIFLASLGCYLCEVTQGSSPGISRVSVEDVIWC